MACAAGVLASPVPKFFALGHRHREDLADVTAAEAVVQHRCLVPLPFALVARGGDARHHREVGVDDACAVALRHAPSELALNSAGFTLLAFPNALRIGSSRPLYVAGLLRLDPRITPWPIDTPPAPAGIDPCTSELLPEPATPVTTTSTPNGMSTSTSQRLCSAAPRISSVPVGVRTFSLSKPGRRDGDR